MAQKKRTIFILMFIVFVVAMSKFLYGAQYTITLTDEQDNCLKKYVSMRNDEAKQKDYKSVDLNAQDFLQNEIVNLMNCYKGAYINMIKDKEFRKLNDKSIDEQENAIKNLSGKKNDK